MQKKKSFPQEMPLSRVGYIILLGIFASLCMSAIFLLRTKEVAFEFAFLQLGTREVATEETAAPEAFPISVDPSLKLVVENNEVETFLTEHYSYVPKKNKADGWLAQVIGVFSHFSWYQNLASPISRILVVDSGERKEEVVHNFARILSWDETQKARFSDMVINSAPKLQDGKFYPGHYVLQKDASPEDAARVLTEAFNSHVLARYPEEVDSIVPLGDALIIASLLEREAAGFEDMRYISGIIWNRLFTDMKLQLDATLQYANANQGASTWWPKARPEDKYIDSPFNTYAHEGLPPSPIANPSPEAIVAALNPKKTTCIFYFHDQKGGFHCTETYEEHVALLKQHYGQGR